MELSRRGLFGLGSAAAGAAVLAGCGGGGSGGGGNELRVTSYGDPTKLKIRGSDVSKFNSTHPKIKMSYEGYPTTNYFDKLATQFSGGNAPDVINMDPVHLEQYAKSGSLQALDGYVPKPLRTTGFETNLLAQGKDNDKLYGVPVGVSTYGIGYNSTLLKKLGIRISPEWTYDSFAQLVLDIHKAGGTKLHGTEDASGDWPSFEVYLRAHGAALYHDAKSLAFKASILTQWWQYWMKLRKNGGCVPADVAASYIYDDNSGGPIIKKQAAIEHIYTPNFTGGYQSLTKDVLLLVTPPLANSNGKHGAYQSPSSVMVMNSRCKKKDNGAAFIDWFTNSPASGKILRFISGPMASSIALAGVKGSTSTAEAEVVRYTKAAPTKSIAAPPLAPAADSQLNSLFLRTAQDISFGRQNINGAVPSFLKQANAILAS